MPGVSVELKISFDGNVPGLSQHRLSMSAFANALKFFSSAFQQTAKELLNDSTDDNSSQLQPKRKTKRARRVDLELVGVEQGSAVTVYEVVARPTSRQQLLNLRDDDEVLKQIVTRLLRHIENAGQGKPCSTAVRKYLAELPSGIQCQRYTAARDGISFAEINIEHAPLPSNDTRDKRLIQLRGNVVSVGFPPGHVFVCVKTDKRTLRCAATIEQVNEAIGLRNSPVAVAILDSDKPELLWIRSEGERPLPAVRETFEHTIANWPRTLEILAR